MAKSTKGSILDVLHSVLMILLNLIFYSFVVFALFEIGRGAYDFSYEVFGEVVAQNPPGKDVNFAITSEQTALDVAKSLKANGLVVSTYSFYVREQMECDSTHVITPGNYVLNTSMTYEEILGKILQSKA